MIRFEIIFLSLMSMNKIMKYYILFLLIYNQNISYSQNTTDSLIIYYKTSKALFEENKIKDAERQILLGFTYHKKNNLTQKLGNESLLLGQIQKGLSQFENALLNLDNAIKYFNPNKESHKIAQAHLEKGRILVTTAKYSQALSNFHNALIIFEKNKLPKKIATVKMNIGNVFTDIRNYKYAIKNYREAIKIYADNNEESGLAGCYNNIGNIYTAMEKFDSASFYLNKSLTIREKNNEFNLSGQIFQNLASIHLQLLNLDSADYFIQKSYQIHQNNTNSFALHLDYYFIGEIYKEKKDYRKAYKYYKLTYDWAFKHKFYQMFPEVALSLGESLYEEGKTSEASYYYHLNKFYKDSLEIDSYKIEEKYINYEIVKDSLVKKQLVLQKGISEIENDNLNLQETIASNRFVYLMLFVIIVLISGLIIYISIKKRLNQTSRHKQILETQNEELKRTLISKEEKETLLKEIHHRVKNNLQIISSLIRLQSHYTSKDNYLSKINDTENRIRSMALVHEKLYKSENLSKLNAKTYIIELVENILVSSETNTPIHFRPQIDSVQYSIDTLIPLGLIINEIVSNSIKYAFFGKESGVISITLKQKDNLKTIITISDNGIGTDIDYDELSENSLGMELIQSLVEQLDGVIDFDTSNGFKYILTFSKLK